MLEYTSDYLLDNIWIVLSIASAIIVFISSVADRRRHKRKYIENVGFMPWTGITILGVMMTILSIALAIKS
jgi:hypothetical protein